MIWPTMKSSVRKKRRCERRRMESENPEEKVTIEDFESISWRK
jgi:hypothetical protein